MNDETQIAREHADDERSIRATALIRAEAYLRTIGKWKGES